MRVFHRLEHVPTQARGCAVAIGNFDGIHLGHQRVFAETAARAREFGVATAVLTFSPHPRRFFNPLLPPFSLASTRVKLDRISRHGVAFTFIQGFSATFACLSAKEFVNNVLVGQLGVSHVVVGEDYRFGRGRQGDVDLLRAMGMFYGFGVTVAAPFQDESGQICSSSRVRDEIAGGRPAEASELLGEPWQIQGTGLPNGNNTVSLSLGGHQRPKHGNYAVAAVADRRGQPNWDHAVYTTGRFAKTATDYRDTFDIDFKLTPTN